MPNISELKKEFDKLPMSLENYPLYSNLLFLDISDFKPLMEALLVGNLDIEDTRPIFSPFVNFQWVKPSQNLKDPRIALDSDAEYLASSTVERINGNESAIIKESLAFPNTQSLKKLIAEEYKRREGIELPEEDLVKLLPIVQEEMVIELSLYNQNAVKDKDYQLLLADLISIKPKSEI